MRRVAAFFDRSRPGRRLSVRLWRAQVHMSPSSWRCAQVLVAVPIATVLAAVSVGAMPAIAIASTVVRVGSGLLLRVRRCAASTALNRVAPALARALATELAASGSGAQAIAGAASRIAVGGAPMASHILQAAAARVVLGGDAASSLQRSIEDAVPDLRATSAGARVGAVFALHRHDAAATASALDRLAAALEEQATLRSDVHAAFAEVRMSAAAVPLIAGACLAMLLASDPPAMLAALSPPLLPLLAIAAVVVMGTSLGVRRLVSA
ncbi:MAG TPA: hypothetical protein VN193_00775 [Candidatus Angelobacter sp.]|nr:hypothetical protein [Candidatus Angelobacter sp.]